MDDELGFDLAAASLRADAGELDRAVEVFARKLEDALPGGVRVKRRRRGVLSRATHVAAVEVDLGESAFALHNGRHGLVAERTVHVHDMARRTERLDVDAWLAALEAALRERAATSAEARAALERLLG